MTGADLCREQLDDGRIARLGLAALLECPSRESVTRRAAALMTRGYSLLSVQQTLDAWAELHPASAA